MKYWFVGGDDLRIMSEDDVDSVTWGQRDIMIPGGDAWLEADEDFICSARIEVAGPTDVTLRFLYTPQAQGIFQAALTELQLIWPDIRAKDRRWERHTDSTGAGRTR